MIVLLAETLGLYSLLPEWLAESNEENDLHDMRLVTMAYLGFVCMAQAKRCLRSCKVDVD